jgi:hypothetical protein
VTVKILKAAAVAMTAVGVGVVLMAAARQERKGESIAEKDHRTTWEYKIRSFDDPKMDAEKTFNELGRDGWEFAGAYRSPGSSGQFAYPYDYAVFKRPIAK